MRRQKVRGAQRMRERGCKLVQVWLDKNEAAVIEAAATKKGAKLATWVREVAFREAQQVVTQPIKGGR
jgi:uncharacterized protein (DUF1778 family)